MVSHDRPGDCNPIPTTIVDARRPRVRFALACAGGVVELAEAPPDRLDDVIRYLAGTLPDANLGEPFDNVIFMGERAVAVVEHREGQVPRVIRLDGGRPDDE